MTRLRLARAALLLGVALLVIGFFVPWLAFTMYGGPDGATVLPLTWSPANVLWSGLGNPSALAAIVAPRSPFLATSGALYLGGALAVVALALPALRSPRRDGALSPLPWTLLAGAITCGVVALLMLPPVPQFFGLSAAFGIVSMAVAAGLELAVAGALLAAGGVIALATGAATRDT
ncbi:MAG: hypothetical protein ACRDID_13070, partial [Ktedonobacterales bacterium]